MTSIKQIARNVRVNRRGVRHRRQRVVSRGLATFLIQRIRSFFYYVGATSERYAKRIRRKTKRALAVGAAAVVIACTAVVSFLGNSLSGFWDDLVNPFRKLKKTVRSFISVMQEMKDASVNAKIYRIRSFFRYGWKWNRQMMERFASVILPIVCCVVCVCTIHSILNLNYVVAVTYNGSEVGYVKNENVYDNAVKLIDERLVDVGETGWRPSARLSISVAEEEEVANEETMATALLSSAGSEIVEATGLYVGGRFFGATTAGTMLSNKLQDVLAPYEEEAANIGPNINVRFTREIRLEEGIYPSDSVLSFSSICDAIDSDEEQDIYYSAKVGEDPARVAEINGITLEKLQQLNPDVDLEEETVTENCELLVAKQETLFAVKTIGNITKVTSIPFDYKITKSSKYDLGYYYLVTSGSAGERTTVTEVEYRNGVEISRRIVSEKVTKEPVDQEIVVGVGGNSSSGVGSGVFAWPTGRNYGISSYFGWRTLRGAPNFHTGLDIAADRGIPIYAADDGIIDFVAYTNTGYGVYCIIDHQNGIVTLYGHCSALLVEQGDVVKKGQTIALVGSTGNSTGNHLHFEVRVHGEKVDPLIYLSA